VVLPEVVLLPGLDGTGDLFDGLLSAAPRELTVRVLKFPRNRSDRYSELADWVSSALPSRPVALVAESFSGPLAVLVANRCPAVVAVVLCASFVEPPLPRALRALAPLAGSWAPPVSVIRWLMAGGDASLARTLRRALATNPPSTIASRINSALSVDVVADLLSLSQPLLCLIPTRDRLLSSRSFQRVRDLKPSARFVELRAPHLLLQSAPAAACLHIVSFLRDTVPRGAD